MNKITRGITLSLILILVAYLFYPLSSKKFAINHDQDQLDAKNKFLTSIQTGNDSTITPNIIIILADDLGKTDISKYGSKLINTPFIDSIGINGITFSEAYTTASVCTPSRAGLLTGRYQQRFGMEFQIHETYLTNLMQYYGMKFFVDSDPWYPIRMNSVPNQEDINKQGLPPSEITFGELAKARGYETALIGKWHLGYADELSPRNFGFDYFYGFKSSHHLYAREDNPDIISQRIEEDWTDQYIWGCLGNADCNLYRNEELVEQEGYLTDVLAEEAIKFIDQNQNNPFLLYIPFNAPHTPLQVPGKYIEQFSHIEDPVKRVYLSMIKSLDDAVGRITTKVDELGLSENTLVIFLSDNGGATYTKTTDNAPLRGGKITQFEGGVNIPMMMQWKGKIEKGSKFIFPATTLDIFSTIAILTGSGLPKERTIDGKDLMPYITRQVTSPPHESIFWQGGYNKAIRYEQWKLIYNDLTGQTLLFNMAADKFEERNFAEVQPDLVNRLKVLHADWASKLAAPLWPGMIEFRHREGEEWFGFIN
jgi:arylsulfatase A-like enzyme